jgi:CheY-like chemotaxis protein
MAVESIKPTAKTKDINISTEISAASLSVWGDADRLQQVLWNLLSNAVKFTPPGGEVQINLREKVSSAQISVRDTGQGIAAEFLPFVFDRFSQADATSARKFGGLGLGLSIVRHLVEMHGGTVEAESEGDGRGATLIINLPLLRQSEFENELNFFLPSATGVISNVSAQSLKEISLLIVEDDADSRELLTTILKAAGARVAAVGSAAEALEALKVSNPDVLISDIGMPGEDGYSLIRRVREINHNNNQIPAIALTAYAREEDSQKALGAGFQMHFAKPFDQSELISAIRILAESRLKQ